MSQKCNTIRHGDMLQCRLSDGPHPAVCGKRKTRPQSTFPKDPRKTQRLGSRRRLCRPTDAAYPLRVSGFARKRKAARLADPKGPGIAMPRRCARGQRSGMRDAHSRRASRMQRSLPKNASQGSAQNPTKWICAEEEGQRSGMRDAHSRRASRMKAEFAPTTGGCNGFDGGMEAGLAGGCA